MQLHDKYRFMLNEELCHADSSHLPDKLVRCRTNRTAVLEEKRRIGSASTSPGPNLCRPTEKEQSVQFCTSSSRIYTAQVGSRESSAGDARADVSRKQNNESRNSLQG
jgi:hypothetical protein